MTLEPTPFRPQRPYSATKFLASLFVMAVASVLLAWLPIVGPFVAGYIGGRTAGETPEGLSAAGFITFSVVVAFLFVSGQTRYPQTSFGFPGSVEAVRAGVLIGLWILGGVLALGVRVGVKGAHRRRQGASFVHIQGTLDSTP